jgi:UDP-N-acetyl-D-glucosamine dehydrogenase
MTKIGIVGLGYVGLPLALQFARNGVQVVGIDLDSKKVEAVNRGESYIRHISAEEIAGQVQAGRFRATTDFAEVQSLEAVIICVPTPLNKNREPDISFVLNTGRAIAPFLSNTEKLKTETLKSKGGARSETEKFQLSAFSVSAFPKLVVLESTGANPS